MKRLHTISPLFGKTVVITGASSGIGKATAEAFAREGSHLVLASRGEDALHDTAQICRKLGAKVLIVPTDTSIPEEVDHLAKEALRMNGRIDYWINNAGVLSFGKFEETPVEIVDQIVKTNLLGYMHGAHAVLPIFKKQKKGVLINNISIGGWMPAPYGTAYTASKYGIRGMVETLQGEVSDYPDIYICGLYPGFQKSSGIEHAANYSGIKLSTPPPAFDPRKLADSIVKVVKKPSDAVYPEGFSIAFKSLYGIAPGLIRNVSSMAMRTVMKMAHKDHNTDGNILEQSKGNMGIDGKTLLPKIPDMVKLTAGVITVLAALRIFKAAIRTKS